MTELLIQIINYNTKDYLRECLDGLLRDLREFEAGYKIVILDNCSSDDLSDLEKSYGSDKVIFRNAPKNLGFGGGHNYISAMFESRFMLILNSDLRFIEKNTVKRLYDRLSGDNSYSAIGPALIIEDMTLQPFDHGELKGIISLMKNNYGSSYWKPRQTEAEAAWVSGAVFMCRTNVFRAVGGFDENFFLYKEEEDLCKRIRDISHKILYYPEVKVMHIGHVVASRSEHFDESMNYYLDKHFRNKTSYKILNTIKSAKDILLYGKVKQRS